MRVRNLPQGVAIVADAWRPATELEHRMQESLRKGDDEGFFRLLADAELFVPVSPDLIDGVLAGTARPGWPVREDGGRTHVTAYTSSEAMRACLGPAYRHYVRLRFADAAAAWPEPRWWLLVDAGLPIEARLPAWFLQQLASGDPLPPQAGPRRTEPVQPVQPVQQVQPEPTAARPAAAPGLPPGFESGDPTATVPDPRIAERRAAAPSSPHRDEQPADPLPAPHPHPQRPQGDEHVAPTAPVPPPVPPTEPAGDESGSFPGRESVGAAAGDTGPQPDPALVTGPLPIVGSSDEPAERETGPQPAPAPAERRGFEPANEVERELLRTATQDDHDGFVRALFAAEVLLPIPKEMDFALRPGRPDFPWQTTDVAGDTVVPVFTSIDRLRDFVGLSGAAGGEQPVLPEFMKLPFGTVARYWPDTSWTLGVNTGTPVGASLPGERLPALSDWADRLTAQRSAVEFEPQNDVEQRLLDAGSDADAFFKILMSAQVLVPAGSQTPWGIQPDDAEFPWGPVQLHGTTTIQVFTSLKWMHEAIGSSRFVMPGLVDILAAWPHDSWSLVLNPGTPITAFLPAERIRALAEAARPEPATSDTGPLSAQRRPDLPAEPLPAPAPAPAQQTEQPIGQPAGNDVGTDVESTPAEPSGSEREVVQQAFEPGNRIDQELFEAAAGGDSDTFLRVLLAANVLVPIPDDAPLEVTAVQPEFHWGAALRDDSTVQVFTSLVRLREVLPTARFVYADFRELIGVWPNTGWAMTLNPGTRIGASLRGEQVAALSEWAIKVGLIQPGGEPAVPGVPPAPPSSRRTAPQPAAAGSAAAEQIAAEQGRPADAGEVADEPTVLQKVLPHGHVGWYLEQGYDRVGGFVYPVPDVIELQTPAQLYHALGLLHEESPFSLDDEGVYVIRWPAYCPELYRIPFGGQSEEELQSWGEVGWVLERAPFQGGGFAPGSAGSIREFKAVSVRLPYGAEMYYIAHDRSEQFVAMYDSDRQSWLRPATVGESAERSEPAQAEAAQ